MIGRPIARENMFEPMLDACPSFLPQWKEFLKDRQEFYEKWGAAAGDFPWYTLLSELAFHISDLIQTQTTSELDGVFDVIERWVLEGDEYVNQACVVGLLETVKWAGTTGSKDTPVKTAFRSRLRPASKKEWDAI